MEAVVTHGAETWNAVATFVALAAVRFRAIVTGRRTCRNEGQDGLAMALLPFPSLHEPR
jgi:hypothetical protein